MCALLTTIITIMITTTTTIMITTIMITMTTVLLSHSSVVSDSSRWRRGCTTDGSQMTVRFFLSPYYDGFMLYDDVMIIIR